MKVGLLGAGGPAGFNVLRSLREAGHAVVSMDMNPYHFAVLPEPKVVQPCTVWEDKFMPWLAGVCDEFGLDFVHSQPEEGVEILARFGHQLPAKTLVPSIQTVMMCQDKFETSWRWSNADLRRFPVQRVEIEEQIDEAIEKIGLPLWMRATRGAGARGATCVESREMAFHWWQYWRSRNSNWEWILEEFLPGRDYAWTSLWFQGELITSQARQRLEYIYPHLAPSGRTGTPTVAVTVHDEYVNRMAMEAVLTVDQNPHGLFCVDLREDADEVPRPTEINAGRFFTTSSFYTAAGLNIPDLCVRLACDIPIDTLPEQFNPLPEDLYWVRHMDIPAQLLKQGMGVFEFEPVWEGEIDPLWYQWYDQRRPE